MIVFMAGWLAERCVN